MEWEILASAGKSANSVSDGQISCTVDHTYAIDVINIRCVPNIPPKYIRREASLLPYTPVESLPRSAIRSIHYFFLFHLSLESTTNRVCPGV